MLLPERQFNNVDDSLGKLFACTFPADSAMVCHPVAPYSAMFATEESELLFKVAEKQLIEEMHKNEHVCTLHTCRLPPNWDNQFDS
jgi:hypothetical protein